MPTPWRTLPELRAARPHLHFFLYPEITYMPMYTEQAREQNRNRSSKKHRHQYPERYQANVLNDQPLTICDIFGYGASYYGRIFLNLTVSYICELLMSYETNRTFSFSGRFAKRIS
jgi:hypothetical protein